MKPISYARHGFPPDVIRNAVWVYLRFTLSCRDVENLLAERGLNVSNESIRRWVLKFGPAIARNMRRARRWPDDRWHLDEMIASIAELLDVLVQPQRDRKAALKLFRKLFRQQGFVLTVIVTDKLGPYRAALPSVGFAGWHEQGLPATNRAENSHHPLRRRERKIQGFKSTKSAQRFVFVHAAIYNTFDVQRHLTTCSTHRQFRAAAQTVWYDAAATAPRGQHQTSASLLHAAR